MSRSVQAYTPSGSLGLTDRIRNSSGPTNPSNCTLTPRAGALAASSTRLNPTISFLAPNSRMALPFHSRFSTGLALVTVRSSSCVTLSPPSLAQSALTAPSDVSASALRPAGAGIARGAGDATTGAAAGASAIPALSTVPAAVGPGATATG